MIITLPWPVPQLFPNFKRAHHWRKYRNHERDARALGWGLAMETIPPVMRQAIAQSDDPISMTVTFIPPDRRKRDDDGCIGAFKNFRDGIADALGADDRRFRPHYEIVAPEKPGRIEVAFS